MSLINIDMDYPQKYALLQRFLNMDRYDSRILVVRESYYETNTIFRCYCRDYKNDSYTVTYGDGFVTIENLKTGEARKANHLSDLVVFYSEDCLKAYKKGLEDGRKSASEGV